MCLFCVYFVFILCLFCELKHNVCFCNQHSTLSQISQTAHLPTNCKKYFSLVVANQQLAAGHCHLQPSPLTVMNVAVSKQRLTIMLMLECYG